MLYSSNSQIHQKNYFDSTVPSSKEPYYRSSIFGGSEKEAAAPLGLGLGKWIPDEKYAALTDNLSSTPAIENRHPSKSASSSLYPPVDVNPTTTAGAHSGAGVAASGYPVPPPLPSEVMQTNTHQYNTYNGNVQQQMYGPPTHPGAPPGHHMYPGPPPMSMPYPPYPPGVPPGVPPGMPYPYPYSFPYPHGTPPFPVEGEFQLFILLLLKMNLVTDSSNHTFLI